MRTQRRTKITAPWVVVERGLVLDGMYFGRCLRCHSNVSHPVAVGLAPFRVFLETHRQCVADAIPLERAFANEEKLRRLREARSSLRKQKKQSH